MTNKNFITNYSCIFMFLFKSLSIYNSNISFTAVSKGFIRSNVFLNFYMHSNIVDFLMVNNIMFYSFLKLTFTIYF